MKIEKEEYEVPELLEIDLVSYLGDGEGEGGGSIDTQATETQHANEEDPPPEL